MFFYFSCVYNQSHSPTHMSTIHNDTVSTTITLSAHLSGKWYTRYPLYLYDLDGYNGYVYICWKYFVDARVSVSDQFQIYSRNTESICDWLVWLYVTLGNITQKKLKINT